MTPSPSSTIASTPTSTPTVESRDPFALAKSYRVDSADELAQRILASDQAIQSGASDIRDHAARLQAAYRQLVDVPDWRDDVYEKLPRELRLIATANVAAGIDLKALTPPRDRLPPWRIVPPPPASELRRAYNDAARTFAIEWTYLAAIHLVETRMGRIRGTSVAGAKGPMQFLPSTWARWGKGDIEDPHDAIMAAGRYLKGRGAPRDMQRALYAYNHSERYVRAISLYAEVMRRDPRAYDAYHAWQVYYRTTKGDALLYEGWPSK